LLKSLQFKAVCWNLTSTQKQLFVLVKGNLQGASTKLNSKGKKNQNYPPISKQSFLRYFHDIHKKATPQQDANTDSLSYLAAKTQALDYNKASEEFFSVYRNWLRIDREKYYNFS
jgi:hypothetical protein